jgi:hypothetical protein
VLRLIFIAQRHPSRRGAPRPGDISLDNSKKCHWARGQLDYWFCVEDLHVPSMLFFHDHLRGPPAV